VNWSQGDQVPAVVQVDLTNPLVIPLGGGSVQAVAASILVSVGHPARRRQRSGRRRVHSRQHRGGLSR
jgi:hypothetical protein